MEADDSQEPGAANAALHSSLQDEPLKVDNFGECFDAVVYRVVHAQPQAFLSGTDIMNVLSSSERMVATGGDNKKAAAKIETNEAVGNVGGTRNGLSQASCNTVQRMEFVDGLSDPWVDCLQLSYPADEEYVPEFQIHTQSQHKRPLAFSSKSGTGRRCKAKWLDQSNTIEVSEGWAWKGPEKQVNWNYNHVDTSNAKWTQFNNNGNTKQRYPLGGMIFGCNKQTWKVCKKLHLFGLPAENAEDVLRVVPGTKLFLFNFETKNLSGAFEATSNGGLDIVPNGFFPFGQLTAQVRVKRIFKYPGLPVEMFRNAIRENFYSRNKFRFDLTALQVEKLLNVFKSAQELCR